MKSSHPDTPATDFAVPPGVTLVRANELTGQPMPAGAPGARWIPFGRGTVPPRFSTGLRPGEFATAGNLGTPAARAPRPR
jgi:hypothetical protein